VVHENWQAEVSHLSLEIGQAVLKCPLPRRGIAGCASRRLPSNYYLPLSSKVQSGAYADAKKQGAVLGWSQFLTVL
jgi:hypothetical protein